MDMALLHEAAVLASAIRGAYRVAKSHGSTTRYFVYVLLLQSGKLYVGSTDNPFVRFGEHFACSPSSAAWVREWGPPVRVVEMCRDCRSQDEHYKYAEYAEKFGWENVRGGGCCRVIMTQEPPSVAAFSRGNGPAGSDFQYLSRAEIDDIVAKVQRI
jgi:hypothetical protein